MRRLTLGILIASLTSAASAHAQPANQRTIPFEGAEVFCQILHHEGLKPIQSLDALAQNQKDTLLIVFGNPFRAKEASLTKYVAKGGNLLVVTDYPFVSGLGIDVNETRIEQPMPWAYHGKLQCPLLRSSWGDDHPIFAALRNNLATNRPTSLSIGNGPQALRPLMKMFSADNGIDFRFNYIVGSPKDAPPQGRILFIAGQGMFMNGMMLQTDNDNFEFAANAIRWLREGPDGTTRSRALLLVDGTIVTDFNMDLSPGAAPPPIPIPPVRALNRLIRGMEEERLFHKILHGLLGDHADRVIGVLFAVASFALLIYGAKKFMEARFHHETGVPRMVGVMPPLTPVLRRGLQRQLALERQPDAAKESRQLVHAWLRAEFGVDPEQWSADTPIEFRAAGAIWSRRGPQRRADEMLRVARGAELTPVSRDPFARLSATLTELTEARKAGRLALLVGGKNIGMDRGQQKIV